MPALTITFDNGKEFADHGRIASELCCSVYFANPYHSWERGLNENTNGVLREFFGKVSDFTKLDQAMVDAAVTFLNHRPRESLGWKSPHEVYYGVEMPYSQIAMDVALSP